CPWCYIGKRRLESALKRFPHRDEVEILWRSFELDADAPRNFDGTADERIAKKYGMSLAQAATSHERVTTLAAKEGLEYHFEYSQYGNTFDAHRLIHFAKTKGLQGEMKERLMKAYFTEGEAISDIDTLVKLAVELGMNSDEVRAVLEGDSYASEVRADEELAIKFGIQGVPFFVINRKYGISGAQPVEAFLETLERAREESAATSAS
ncbi:MAG TPA: disulfide bond formation protein DsbA, partial [Fibrobacteres bacterium]|nr:disulfide bond formation protein DsbA [Fibrobacterota bacterium]